MYIMSIENIGDFHYEETKKDKNENADSHFLYSHQRFLTLMRALVKLKKKFFNAIVWRLTKRVTYLGDIRSLRDSKWQFYLYVICMYCTTVSLMLPLLCSSTVLSELSNYTAAKGHRSTSGRQ